MENNCVREDIALKDLYPVITEVVAGGGEFHLYPRGISMLPTLVPNRDSVVLAAPDGIGRGDIILYRRKNGVFVLHRVVGKKRDGSFVLRGDNQIYNERGVLPEHIIAVVVRYTHKGKTVVRGSRAARRAARFPAVRAFLLHSLAVVSRPFRRGKGGNA